MLSLHLTQSVENTKGECCGNSTNSNSFSPAADPRTDAGDAAICWATVLGS